MRALQAVAGATGAGIGDFNPNAFERDGLISMPIQPSSAHGRFLLLLACLVLHVGTAGAAESERPAPWAFTTLYSHSALSGGRGNWEQLDNDLLYTASPRWIFGGSVDVRRRYSASDTLFGASVSFLPNAAWELHASAKAAPSAEFSPRRSYESGVQWRASQRWSLLLDARRFEFPGGSLRELRPGVIFWFDEATALTARYTDGRAFGSTGYHAYSLRLDHDFNAGQRLSIGYAHGIDPEQDPSVVPGVLLSESDLLTAYYRFPLRARLNLIVGAEYEDRHHAYTRAAASLGLSKRF